MPNTKSGDTKARGGSIQSSTRQKSYRENAANRVGSTRLFFARNNATGEWFAASLGWSANWKIRVTSKVEKSPVDRSDSIDRPVNEARLFFEMGPSSVDPVLRVVEPGEVVKTPETHILCMKSDLDHVTQALANHVRRDVLPHPPSEHVFDVEANHRGYIVDHETEAGIDREIDLAADIGAESFFIDAGGDGTEPNHWYDNTGDWYAGDWLPNDVGPIREYVRKKGMRFGLWVEIEAAGAASKLRKEHRDWILTRNGQPFANGRHLDVGNPVVAKWMESEMARIIKKYELHLSGSTTACQSKKTATTCATGLLRTRDGGMSKISTPCSTTCANSFRK